MNRSGCGDPTVASVDASWAGVLARGRRSNTRKFESWRAGHSALSSQDLVDIMERFLKPTGQR